MTTSRITNSEDWEETLAAYYEGDVSAEELSQCASKCHDLKVRRWIESVVLVEQDFRAPESVPLPEGLVQKTVDRITKTGETESDEAVAPIVVPLEFDIQTRICRETLLRDEILAAASAEVQPSQMVREACSLHRAQVNRYRLERYLDDDWKLNVIISPGGEVASVTCGDQPMDHTGHGRFTLQLPRERHQVLRRTGDDMTICVSGGRPLRIVFEEIRLNG